MPGLLAVYIWGARASCGQHLECAGWRQRFVMQNVRILLVFAMQAWMSERVNGILQRVEGSELAKS